MAGPKSFLLFPSLSPSRANTNNFIFNVKLTLQISRQTAKTFNVHSSNHLHKPENFKNPFPLSQTAEYLYQAGGHLCETLQSITPTHLLRKILQALAW